MNKEKLIHLIYDKIAESEKYPSIASIKHYCLGQAQGFNAMGLKLNILTSDQFLELSALILAKGEDKNG